MNVAGQTRGRGASSKLRERKEVITCDGRERRHDAKTNRATLGPLKRSLQSLPVAELQ